MSYLKKLLSAEELDAMRKRLATRAEKLYPDPVCDICGSEEPHWVYASQRMSTGEVRECWRWTACPRCSRDIDNGNWDAIKRRLVAWLALQMPHALDYQLSEAAGHAVIDFLGNAITVQ